MDIIVNDNANKENGNGGIVDYSTDFSILSSNEKQSILKSAKTLLKIQKENNAIIADAIPQEGETGIC